MGKKDGKEDLVSKKRNWLKRKSKEYGSLAKLLLWGKRKKPIGFAQFGPIFEFQTAQIIYQKNKFTPPAGGWCLTCLALESKYRGRGLATKFLENILRDLKKRGVKIVDGYPFKKVKSWNQVSTGPLALYQKLGFEVIYEDERRAIVRKKLT